MPLVLAASISDVVKAPSMGSATPVSSSGDWLAGEKAMRNSGKASMRAPLAFASLMSFSASLRLDVFSVEDVICASAMRIIEESSDGVMECWNDGSRVSKLQYSHSFTHLKLALHASFEFLLRRALPTQRLPRPGRRCSYRT